MNFELTEEMRMLKEMAYKFAVAEIAPFSAECDEQEKYLPEIRKKAAENGLVGAWIPEAYGGSAPAFWVMPSLRRSCPKSIWASA